MASWPDLHVDRGRTSRDMPDIRVGGIRVLYDRDTGDTQTCFRIVPQIKTQNLCATNCLPHTRGYQLKLH